MIVRSMASPGCERARRGGRLEPLAGQVEQAQDGGQHPAELVVGHGPVGVVHELLEEALLLREGVEAVDPEAAEGRRGG